MDQALITAVADAIDKAQCPDRHGPYGMFTHPADMGRSRHIICDLRDLRAPEYGAVIFETDVHARGLEELERLTREHVAEAAIKAMLRWLGA